MNQIRKMINKKLFFSLSVLSAFVCLLATVMHYNGKYQGNSFTWAAWILSMVFMLIAFLPEFSVSKKISDLVDKKHLIVFISLSAFFLITHFWNFWQAPWGVNGIFDDAAWDVYFSQNHIFTDQPFQVAFFDNVGNISREVIYHYYITIFFKLFGYNLLVMNISLVILSFITFIFTCLLIQRLFKNYIVTIASAVVLNFFPLHFMQTFAGHRYASAAPLIMSSLYFVYTGFKDKSYLRLCIGGFLASLCVDSAVMGKQYLIGLAGAAVLILIFDFKKTFNGVNWKLFKVFFSSLAISMIPMIVYIIFNPVYFQHERDLTGQFFNVYNARGLEGIKVDYLNRFLEVIFGKFSYYRWFSADFITIPLIYYLFLVPGTVIALLKKRFEILYP